MSIERAGGALIRARGAIALLLLFVCRFAFGQVANEPAMLTREQAVADFDQFWNEIAHRYVYLHNKHISWRKARDLYRPRAVAARTNRDLLHVLEAAIAELYDDHATIGTDAPGSPRIVPSRDINRAKTKAVPAKQQPSKMPSPSHIRA